MVNVKKEFPSESKVIVGARETSLRGPGPDHGRHPRDPGKDRKLLFTDVTLGAM
jgi:hypothetical protein